MTNEKFHHIKTLMQDLPITDLHLVTALITAILKDKMKTTSNENNSND